MMSRYLLHYCPGKEEIISAMLDLDGTKVDHSHWRVVTAAYDVKARFLQERHSEIYRDLTSLRLPAARRIKKGKRKLSTPREIRKAY